MSDEPLSERVSDHTRSTRRVVASETRQGDIVRIAAVPSSSRAAEPRTERAEAEPPQRPFVPPPEVVDIGHVRIVRPRWRYN